MLAKVEELWGRRGVICVPLCVYVCVVWWWWWWGELDGWEIEKTQARQYLWGWEEIDFLCGKGGKLVLFHQKKFSTKGEREAVERLPSWGKWNPYDSILQTTLNCVTTGCHGNSLCYQGDEPGRKGSLRVSGTREVYWGKSFQHPVAFGQLQLSSLGSCWKCLLSAFSLFFFNFFLSLLLPIFLPFNFNLCIYVFFFSLTTSPLFLCAYRQALSRASL